MLMAVPNTMGGAVSKALVLGTVAFLVILAILVIRSIFFLSAQDSSSTAGGAGGTAAGPVAAAPLDPAATDAVGVRCGRPADGTDSTFRVDTAAGLADQQLIVAVDLVGADGSRHPRIVTLPAVEAGQSRQTAVPDSSDPNLYQACVVTVIQLDRKVIITGR
jgi:hypothetical protein